MRCASLAVPKPAMVKSPSPGLPTGNGEIELGSGARRMRIAASPATETRRPSTTALRVTCETAMRWPSAFTLGRPAQWAAVTTAWRPMATPEQWLAPEWTRTMCALKPEAWPSMMALASFAENRKAAANAAHAIAFVRPLINPPSPVRS